MTTKDITFSIFSLADYRQPCPRPCSRSRPCAGLWLHLGTETHEHPHRPGPLHPTALTPLELICVAGGLVGGRMPACWARRTVWIYIQIWIGFQLFFFSGGSAGGFMPGRAGSHSVNIHGVNIQLCMSRSCGSAGLLVRVMSYPLLYLVCSPLRLPVVSWSRGPLTPDE